MPGPRYETIRKATITELTNAISEKFSESALGNNLYYAKREYSRLLQESVFISPLIKTPKNNNYSRTGKQKQQFIANWLLTEFEYDSHWFSPNLTEAICNDIGYSSKTALPLITNQQTYDKALMTLLHYNKNLDRIEKDWLVYTKSDSFKNSLQDKSKKEMTHPLLRKESPLD
jgi:hypothetical protein